MTPTRIEEGDLVSVTRGRFKGRGGQVTEEWDAEYGQWLIVRFTDGYIDIHSDDVEVM